MRSICKRGTLRFYYNIFNATTLRDLLRRSYCPFNCMAYQFFVQVSVLRVIIVKYNKKYFRVKEIYY